MPKKDRERPIEPADLPLIPMGCPGDGCCTPRTVTVESSVDSGRTYQPAGPSPARPPAEAATTGLLLFLGLLPFLTTFMLMLGYAAAQAVQPTLPAPGYWLVFATASVYYVALCGRWFLRRGR